MTHSVTITGRNAAGNKRQVNAKVDITAYNNLGEAITASEFRLGKIVDLNIVSGEKGYILDWDGSKIHAYNPTQAHSHTALTVNASETAADATQFVSITHGDGTTTSTTVGNAGGGSDTGVTSSDNTAAAGSEVTASTDVGELRVFVLGR